MGFEVDLDDIDTDTIGGFDRVAPGSYHMLIVEVDEDGGRRGEMIVKAEILRGTTPGQEGKEIPLYFTRDMKPLSRRKMLALGIATGLTTKQEIDQLKAAGKTPFLDWQKMVGRQCCANLEDNEYEGKHSTRLAWDEIYHPADKRANHIPLLISKIQQHKPAIVLPPNRHPDGVLAAKNAAAAKQEKPAATTAAEVKKESAKSVDEMLG